VVPGTNKWRSDKEGCHLASNTIYDLAVQVVCAGALYNRADGACINGIWTEEVDTEGLIDCSTVKPNGSGLANPALDEFCRTNGGVSTLVECGDKKYEWDSEYCVQVSPTGIGQVRERCGAEGDASVSSDLTPGPTNAGAWNPLAEFCFNRVGANPAANRGSIAAGTEVRDLCGTSTRYGNTSWCVIATGVTHIVTLTGLSADMQAAASGETFIIGTIPTTIGPTVPANDAAVLALIGATAVSGYTLSVSGNEIIATQNGPTGSRVTSVPAALVIQTTGTGTLSAGTKAEITRAGMNPGTVQPDTECVSANGGSWTAGTVTANTARCAAIGTP
jgi:hypothetical protein